MATMKEKLEEVFRARERHLHHLDEYESNYYFSDWDRGDTDFWNEYLDAHYEVFGFYPLVGNRHNPLVAGIDYDSTVLIRDVEIG